MLRRIGSPRGNYKRSFYFNVNVADSELHSEQIKYSEGDRNSHRRTLRLFKISIYIFIYLSVYLIVYIQYVNEPMSNIIFPLLVSIH